MTKPFVYLAGIGCLIGMLTFLYFTLKGLLVTPIYQSSYIQPLDIFFGGMTAALVLISFGLYAINRVYLFPGSIIGMLTALVAAAVNASAMIDFVIDGPYFVLESGTYTKTLNYYPTALGTLSLVGLVAALAILLHMTNTKTEIISIVSAAFFLISATVVMSSWSWMIAGFIHAFTYALAFGFFASRERIIEEEAIQPL